MGRSPLAELTPSTQVPTPICQRLSVAARDDTALITRDWHGPFGCLTLIGTSAGVWRAQFSATAPRPWQPLPAPWHRPDQNLRVYLAGTEFQYQVWQALTRIPRGEALSYAAFAQGMGRPRAIRAVASAVAANPLPVILPCHRVIRSDGRPGEYIGGTTRKRQLLEAEQV